MRASSTSTPGDGIKSGRLNLKSKASGTVIVGVDFDLTIDTIGPTLTFLLNGRVAVAYYRGAIRTAGAAAGAAFAALRSGAGKRLYVREIGFYLAKTNALSLGIVRAATVGTASASLPTLACDPADAAGPGPWTPPGPPRPPSRPPSWIASPSRQRPGRA